MTGTFLFECDSPEAAFCRLQELQNHADGVLNHVALSPGREKSGRPACFSVGPKECFTLYIRQRQFSIAVYIKQPNIPDAFAKFPNSEVEEALTELAQWIVRVEVTAHGKWLQSQELDRPAAWRINPSAYARLFQLARDTLRLDEGLRVRLPTQEVMDKLPDTYRIVLQAHLKGENVRSHVLVTGGGATPTAQKKRFSAFKCQILEALGIDLSIPWSVQNTQFSPHLKDWFVYPGEYVPRAELAEHVFSRESVPTALEKLQAKIAGVLGRDGYGPLRQIINQQRSAFIGHRAPQGLLIGFRIEIQRRVIARIPLVYEDVAGGALTAVFFLVTSTDQLQILRARMLIQCRATQQRWNAVSAATAKWVELLARPDTIRQQV